MSLSMRSYICVRILRSMCPHTAIYVSAYCFVCVLIVLCMCPHTTVLCPHTARCVRILLYMCPHTAIRIKLYGVGILLYMCPHTVMCVLILLYASAYSCTCPHTTISAPHTTVLIRSATVTRKRCARRHPHPARGELNLYAAH